jgi:hypothetical protein
MSPKNLEKCTTDVLIQEMKTHRSKSFALYFLIFGTNYPRGRIILGGELSRDEFSGDELSWDELSGGKLSGDELSCNHTKCLVKMQQF